SVQFFVGTTKESREAVSASGPNNDIIFLVGGVFENSSYGIPLVYIFDTVKNMWNTPTIQGIQPPRRQNYYSVIDITGKMYIFGGLYNVETGNSTSGYENRMDILDTIKLTWSQGSQRQAPTSRDGYSATLLLYSIIAYIDRFDSITGSAMSLNEITVGTIPDEHGFHSAVLGKA
ncbi:13655_t:CDS:2, partial [Dentiscutata erythropus]